MLTQCNDPSEAGECIYYFVHPVRIDEVSLTV